MEYVTSRDLVIPLPWKERAASAPYLLGGAENQIQSLNSLIDELNRVEGQAAAKVSVGSGKARSLSDVTVGLRGCGLLEHKSPDVIDLSDELSTWRETQQPLDLIAPMHRNVQFFGELLKALSDAPKTLNELRDTGNSEYGFEWTSNDQIRRRLNWFRSLDVVNYKTAHSVMLTPLGEEILERLEIVRPDGPAGSFQVDRSRDDAELVSTDPAPKIASQLDQALRKQDSDDLLGRGGNWGYIPQGNKKLGIVESLRSLVSLTEEGVTREAFAKRGAESFGVGTSSLSGALTTLANLGLVEETGISVYSPSTWGRLWLESPTALNLVAVLHVKVRSVLEIIPMLSESSRPPEISRLLAEHSLLPNGRVDDVRKRIRVLEAAGLVEERGPSRFQATDQGWSMFLEYPTESIDAEPGVPVSGTERADAVEASQFNSLADRLLLSGTQADDPAVLERNVAEAFGALGFQSDLLGGVGGTDVLLSTMDSSGREVRIIVEAKSSRAGNIQENALSFDTLNDHKSQHDADMVVVVGPGFEGGRTRERANKSNVRLMTTEELATVLRRYEIAPMSAHNFLSLVAVDSDALTSHEENWASVEAKGRLVQRVLEALADESREPDEVTRGGVSIREIYFLVRPDLDPRPSSDDIKEVVSLLAHSMVGALVESGGRYRLVDTPRVAREKFRALADSAIGAN